MLLRKTSGKSPNNRWLENLLTIVTLPEVLGEILEHADREEAEMAFDQNS